MNSITYGIGHACRYLSEALAFPRQNHNEVTQEESTGFSYQTVVVSSLVIAVGAYVIGKFVSTIYQPVKDTPELFWKELQSNQRPPLPSGPVVIMGQQIAKDLLSLQKEMFSSCDGASKLFVEYMQKEDFNPKNVIDLGCGIGANSIPLLKRNITVIAIDNMEYVLELYKSRVNEKENRFVSLQCADLSTLKQYSTEVGTADVVLAIDVLPYLPISCWKSTMEKIVTSLKPGGHFFCTVFVKNRWGNHPVVAVQERFGGQHYQIHNLAERLVQYSGLEMVECRLRESGYGCYEFVARKPMDDSFEHLA